MADATTKRILSLLAGDQPPEVRRSAALILGELNSKDAAIDAALAGLLADADAAVRAQAITAVGKLKVDGSLKQLLELVEKGGEDSELAAQAAAKLGTRGTKALQDLMHKVAPGLRRRIAGALGAGGTSSAETAAVDSLLDTDPGVVEAATRALIASVPSLTPSHREGLADHLLDLLRDKKNPLTPVSETAVVRLLAALDDERAEKVLWERTQTPHSVDMRAAALQALGKWTSNTSKKGPARRAGPTGDQVKRLLTCAADGDFRVAAPALMMLKEVPISGSGTDWLPLFRAPDSAVRQFAIEKLGDKDRPEIAAFLIEQLDFREGPVREEALSRLGKLKHGRKALVDKLLEADNPDGAWWLARAQAGVVKDFPPALREPVFATACTYLEKNDRRSDALLFWLREADAESLHERLEEKALALRKKKAYATALNYLRYLTRDPACAVTIRLEAAACGLKASSKDVNAEARNGDPCLQQFARLLPNYGAEATAFIDKTKWLDPEDLFYLGFHFAEQNGAPQKFGGHVLHLLLKRSPKSKLAKDARSKLRSAGLD
jgi:HEAT repeat protein